MPPTNTAFATALDLGSTLPINNTQSDINDAGVNFTVFYKFTCPANVFMVWAWATSDQASGYTPKQVPYDDTQTEIGAEASQVPPVILGNNPIQFLTTPGEVHFIQVVKNADTAGPEHVDLVIRAAPNESTIPFESIVVNGDIIGQPCGIFSKDTNFRVIKQIPNIATGEGGCITRTGKTLFDNRNLADRKVKLYDSNYNELGNASINAFAWIRRNQTTGWFWILVMENVGFSKLYKTNPDVLPLSLTLVATLTGAGNGRGISTNNAETIAYYNDNSLGMNVKRWDLTLDIAMSDLASNPGGGPAWSFIDSLTLEDDTILVVWSDGEPAGKVRVIRYNSAGATLNTYGDYDSYEDSFGPARLAYAPDSPVHFWLKLRGVSGASPTGLGIFNKIRVSDGALIATVSHMEYESRNYIGPVAASYPGETGLWNSCPFVVYPLGVAPPSGIYVIQTDRRNDNYIAIPAPTFKTALMP